MRAAHEVVLRADRPSVIEETFDGEAVLVHLETGCYYALNAAGTAVWELVRDGRSPAEVQDLVAAARGADDAETARAFVETLSSERLLIADPAGESADDAPPLDSRPWADSPTLQRFDDLQDLLQVDPIHDVQLGADGWPVAAAP